MKPIIFTTAMVRAILDGRKTQTRRIASDTAELVYRCAKSTPSAPYQVGDIIYVRETFVVGIPDGTEPESESNPMTVFYKADDSVHGWMNEDWDEVNIPWKPSIHMPKKYARLFLRVKDVRIERLNEISEEDAIAEGAIRTNRIVKGYTNQSYSLIEYHYGDQEQSGQSPSDAFGLLWESIYGDGSFDNRYIWVIEFERISKEEAING